VALRMAGVVMGWGESEPSALKGTGKRVCGIFYGKAARLAHKHIRRSFFAK
jgi:hypothetical protein